MSTKRNTVENNTASTQGRVPKLRFPEFSDAGPWNNKPLKKVFSIFQGFAFSSNDSVNAGIRWLKIADVSIQQMNHSTPSYLPKTHKNPHKRFCVKQGDYVVALTRPILNKQLKIARVDEVFDGALLNQRVGKLVPIQNIEFVYYLLQTPKLISDIDNSIAGSEPPNLSAQQIEEIRTYIPFEKEQQKIASFLSSVDELITAHAQKLDALKRHKKGLMQQLFPAEGDTLPKLRFPEFSDAGPWGIKPFEKVFTPITTKNKENNQNVLTISAQKGLVSQLDYFNKKVAAKDVSGYYLLHKGDFAYNKSYSQGYPMGAIKQVKNYDKGVVSILYICFKAKVGYKKSFFEQYFNAGVINCEIEKIAQEGGRNHGLLNVSVKEFFADVSLILPTLPEQQKIASFLSSIDDLITAQAQKLDALKTHKKGLMQQLFPIDNEANG